MLGLLLRLYLPGQNTPAAAKYLFWGRALGRSFDDGSRWGGTGAIWARGAAAAGASCSGSWGSSSYRVAVRGLECLRCAYAVHTLDQKNHAALECDRAFKSLKIDSLVKDGWHTQQKLIVQIKFGGTGVMCLHLLYVSFLLNWLPPARDCHLSALPRLGARTILQK